MTAKFSYFDQKNLTEIFVLFKLLFKPIFKENFCIQFHSNMITPLTASFTEFLFEARSPIIDVSQLRKHTRNYTNAAKELYILELIIKEKKESSKYLPCKKMFFQMYV